MASFSESTTLTTDSNSSNITTAAANIIITDGPIFQALEAELMKVNIWPLVFIFVFTLTGFLGNSIVIYIYWFKWKKNKTRIFIMCLAFIDLINCSINMPVEIAALWQPLTFDMHYLCKISRGLTFVCNNTGSLVFVSVAIERYLLVYYPIKCRQLTPRFSKLMCLTAFIIAVSVSWPSFVFYGSHTLSIPVKPKVYIRGTTCLISDDNLIHTRGLILIFTSVLFALLIVTFIVLTALYIAIGRKIYIATCTDSMEESNRKDSATKLLGKSIISAITGTTTSLSGSKRQSLRTEFNDIPTTPTTPTTDETSTDGDKSYRKTLSKTPKKFPLNKNKAPMIRRFSTIKSRPTRKNTVMMRMVTIAFMLSFTPFLIILVIRYTYTDSEYYLTLDRNGKIVYSVFLRTYFINSMVNPFIYGFMNIHFRKLVKDMLGGIFCSSCCIEPPSHV